MLFNSLDFLIFFPLVSALYFLLPHRLRWFLLLISSCVFYMAFVPVYILILFFTIIIDYFAGILIEKSQGTQRKTFLIISLCSNILILAVFKYFNFFNDNFTILFRSFDVDYSIPGLSMLLPIGLSFHTFQAMSYTIEVYRGNQAAERNFGIYSLYVMFYPQLVAGPIERPQNLLHQFYEKHYFDYTRAVSGLRLMLWGFFKKIVIADNLAVIVNNVYNSPREFDGLGLLIASYAFALQIYCDFSGYSDIAIGCARVMGFKLMQNFRMPYLSGSVAEFWSRWHISLSTWFKDYVYIPLGGNRVSVSRWYLNIFLVFMISGFWHGANWTFIIWGALHGFYLIVESITGRYIKLPVRVLSSHWYGLLKVLLTFNLVTLGWVFFRADSIRDAFYILGKIADVFSYQWHRLSDFSFRAGMDQYDVLSLAVTVISLLIIEANMRRIKSWVFGLKYSSLRIFIYALAILSIIFLGEFSNNQFIYFQF